MRPATLVVRWFEQITASPTTALLRVEIEADADVVIESLLVTGPAQRPRRFEPLPGPPNPDANLVAAFGVPRDVAEGPELSFAVLLADRTAVSLPSPQLRGERDTPAAAREKADAEQAGPAVAEQAATPRTAALEQAAAARAEQAEAEAEAEATGRARALEADLEATRAAGEAQAGMAAERKTIAELRERLAAAEARAGEAEHASNATIAQAEAFAAESAQRVAELEAAAGEAAAQRAALQRTVEAAQQELELQRVVPASERETQLLAQLKEALAKAGSADLGAGPTAGSRAEMKLAELRQLRASLTDELRAARERVGLAEADAAEARTALLATSGALEALRASAAARERELEDTLAAARDRVVYLEGRVVEVQARVHNGGMGSTQS